MTNSLQEFLAERMPLPRVAAWSARTADRMLTSQCYTDWLAPSRVEQALTRVALAAESLQQHGILPVRLCWVVEQVRIHLALRSDTACLALFVENRPGYSGEGVERLLEEFTELELVQV